MTSSSEYSIGHNPVHGLEDVLMLDLDLKAHFILYYRKLFFQLGNGYGESVVSASMVITK